MFNLTKIFIGLSIAALTISVGLIGLRLSCVNLLDDMLRSSYTYEPKLGEHCQYLLSKGDWEKFQEYFVGYNSQKK